MRSDHTGSGGDRMQGASPTGSGHSGSAPSPQAVSASGESPSRMRWQPIETAPRDGSLFLVWVSPGQHDLPAMYSLCAWDEDAGFCICELRQPTHWMPLPPAPCDGSGAAGETRSGSTEGDSAVPAGQAPNDLSSLRGEIARIKDAANTLYTAATKLIAETDKEVDRLSTALAESKRKRKRDLAAYIETLAELVYDDILFVYEQREIASYAREFICAEARRLTPTTQETPDVEG